MNRENLTAGLRPLVSRCHQGHCWIKTKEGPRRIDEPFTEVKLSEHVMGGNAYGLCPIAPGESVTRVAVLDFDSHKGETPWSEMLDTAQKVAGVLELNSYEPSLYRSSGGMGVHIYLLWDEPQDAFSVREALRLVLESCGLKPGTGGVALREVEIFPKQNEVKKDGFGSMFILPGSGKSEYLGGADPWQLSAPVPLLQRTVREERAGLYTPSLERLRGALSAIPNDADHALSYDGWRNIIFAIHYATDGSDEGLSVAHEFSDRSPKSDAAFLDERVWPYISTSRGGEIITDRTIFALAEQNGWIDPEVIDGFEVLKDVSPVGRFPVVAAGDFVQGKAPGWLIKGVLPRAELVVLYGESGSGKTFLALDMVAAISRGVDWRDNRTKQGRVIYIAAEGAAGFRNRLTAYARQHAVELSTLPFGVIQAAPNFTQKTDITDVAKSIGRADVIVVDTLAQVTAGANENSGEDMGRVIAHCKTLHAVTGATVLLVHHSGKDAAKGARGWSGIKGALDAEIEVSRMAHSRVARISKMKDGHGEDDKYGFDLDIVPVGMDDDGDIVTSCVVRVASVPLNSYGKGRRRTGKWEKVVIDAINEAAAREVDALSASEVIEQLLEQNPFEGIKGERDTRRQMIKQTIKALGNEGAAFQLIGDVIKLSL